MAEQALEGSSKLHSLWRGKAKGFQVNTKVCVVGDGARTAVPLGDHAKGRQPEVRVVDEESGWQQNPVAFLNHTNVFLPEEINMILGRLVGTKVQSGELPGEGPSWRLQADWDSMGAVLLE